MTKLKIVLLNSCLLLSPFLAVKQASAMDFRIYYQPELKQRVVIGEGIISNGDDTKFLAAAKNADVDNKGYITFVLDSLGGSVSAAFSLVSAMDKFKISAVVPENALCASACASIVYISAERHLVVGSGKLGFHTCYTAIDRKPEPSSVCNELIAQNAVSRGTSFASVDMFTYDYGPENMAWLDKELACAVGLCRH